MCITTFVLFFSFFHLCHKIKFFGRMDMPTRGHLLRISFVIVYPKIPNKTLKVPNNNTDGVIKENVV